MMVTMSDILPALLFRKTSTNFWTAASKIVTYCGDLHDPTADCTPLFSTTFEPAVDPTDPQPFEFQDGGARRNPAVGENVMVGYSACLVGIDTACVFLSAFQQAVLNLTRPK
jgi:hypothetical protein